MPSLSDAQLDRLSKALRENLMKRKAQMRERLQHKKSLLESEKPAQETDLNTDSSAHSPQKKDLD